MHRSSLKTKAKISPKLEIELDTPLSFADEFEDESIVDIKNELHNGSKTFIERNTLSSIGTGTPLKYLCNTPTKVQVRPVTNEEHKIIPYSDGKIKKPKVVESPEVITKKYTSSKSYM